MKRASISPAKKNIIAGKQHYKCANKPKSNIPYLENYNCVMWIAYNGNFDEAGYEIDHIKELSVSKDNSDKNLHALCISCHKVKTKRFLMNKTKCNEYNLSGNNAQNYLFNMEQKNIKRLAILLNIYNGGTKEKLIQRILNNKINLAKIIAVLHKYNNIISKLEMMKNSELGNICKRHNLYTQGTKYNLINRILKNISYHKLNIFIK